MVVLAITEILYDALLLVVWYYGQWDLRRLEITCAQEKELKRVLGGDGTWINQLKWWWVVLVTTMPATTRPPPPARRRKFCLNLCSSCLFPEGRKALAVKKTKGGSRRCQYYWHLFNTPGVFRVRRSKGNEGMRTTMDADIEEGEEQKEKVGTCRVWWRYRWSGVVRRCWCVGCGCTYSALIYSRGNTAVTF